MSDHRKPSSLKPSPEQVRVVGTMRTPPFSMPSISSSQSGGGGPERGVPWIPWMPKEARDFIEIAGHLDDPASDVMKCRMCGTEHKPGPCPVCGSGQGSVRKARGTLVH